MSSKAQQVNLVPFSLAHDGQSQEIKECNTLENCRKCDVFVWIELFDDNLNKEYF